jgi:hypothetical protein
MLICYSVQRSKKLTMDYSSIATPPACYADFCLIPVGTGSISVAAEVAEVQKVLKASGLKYTMHSAGTTVGMSHFLQLPPDSCGLPRVKPLII